MRTIQIEITNACVRSCANCTRFCGHHKKPFYMTLETFKKAVDSLEGFDGIVGMMGGEPTLHPDFREMAEYIGQKFGKIGRLSADKLVLNDFPSYVACKQAASMVINRDGGAGLWTSITKQYYKYYELIQQTFSFQNLNDHSKPSYHQPVLITRKEYGISDDEWRHLRDNCWIQNYWSASVTPKGVFFCEVAAALDILLDGPGGFPIESGWWKRDISYFESQLHWCELCGVALNTFDRHKRDANEGLDDISPLLYEKLKKAGSRKVEAGNYKLFTATANDTQADDSGYGATRYVEDYSDRFGDSMESLRPKCVQAIGLEEARDYGRTVYNEAASFKDGDWVLLTNGAEAFISAEQIKGLYLNPGICFEKDGQILFNINSAAYKNAGYDGFYGCESVNDIKNLWEPENIVYLDEGFETEHYAPDIKRWEIMAQNDILNDFTFRNELYERISEKAVKKGGCILMLLPVNYMFGRAVYALLENMGYTPHIFIYDGHKPRYDGLVQPDRLHTFISNNMYDFGKLKDECDALKSRQSFDGALMLVNLPYVHLCEKDGYGDVVEIAKYVADTFIGCVNMRRRLAYFTEFNYE